MTLVQQRQVARAAHDSFSLPVAGHVLQCTSFSDTLRVGPSDGPSEMLPIIE